MSKKVKFLQDFRGKETNEVFYTQGQEAEFPDHVAELLVKDGRVEIVAAPMPVHYGGQVQPEAITLDDEQIYNEFVKEAIELIEEVPPDPKPKGKRGKK